MQINIEMTSSRPYLLRALNEWILDNDLTPHIVVDATFENVVVPMQYVEADKIVLNINPGAVSNFNITNEFISFSARFSGKAMEIFVPVLSVLALYSKENGQGMVFNDERAASASAVSMQPISPKTVQARRKTKVEPHIKPAITKVEESATFENSIKDRKSKASGLSKKAVASARPRLKLVD